MPGYRRADTPIATERKTVSGIVRSRILHAHHYRSESNKNLACPEVDRFFALFYCWQIIAIFGFCTWFTWYFNCWFFSLIFGGITLRYLKITLFGERTRY